MTDIADYEEIMIAILKEQEAGMATAEVCRRLHFVGNLGRDARPLATVDLRLLHPLMKRLRNAADLLRDRNHRRPARRTDQSPHASDPPKLDGLVMVEILGPAEGVSTAKLSCSHGIWRRHPEIYPNLDRLSAVHGDARGLVFDGIARISERRVGHRIRQFGECQWCRRRRAKLIHETSFGLSCGLG